MTNTTTDLNATTVSSALFTFNAATRTFVCDVSDLPQHSSNVLNIRSEKSGAVTTFRFFREMRDSEGELTCWIFKSEGLPVVLTLKIIND